MVKTLDVPAQATLLYGGRYELLDLVGAGGAGTVYRARDLELDEIVALKVLRKELVRAPGVIERFRSEVKLARRITHRNIARMFDIGFKQTKKCGFTPIYEAVRMPPPSELNHARRAPTRSHGITMGSPALA